MSNYDLKISLFKDDKVVHKIAYQKEDDLTLSLGRTGYQADLEIPEPHISRKHAAFLIRQGMVSIKDLQSSNGTFLNGQRIEANKYYPIAHEGRVQFGQQSAYYMVVEYFNSAPSLANPIFEASEHIAPSQEQASVADLSVSNASSKNVSLARLFKEKEQIWIGRSKECDIVIPILTISRKHATIQKLSDEKYVVNDFSSNGTYVNGRRVKGSQTISTEDVVTIGDREFSLSRSGDDLILSSIVLFDANKIAIEANELDKVYDNNYHALRKVNFSLKQGTFTAIMGPSGCGKSTLLKALNGANPATGGSAMILGRELTMNYDFVKQFIGYVPQDDIVHGNLSVLDSLYFAAKLRLASDVSEEEINAKIEEVLDNLNINTPTIKATMVKELSGGQRKRVSIAVELLTDPQILFLDEPTSPLDPETIEEFLKCLKKLNEKNTTIMMVTHKPDDLRFVDKVIFLSKGGYLTYFGNADQLESYFKTDNINQVYSQNKTIEQGEGLSQQFEQRREDQYYSGVSPSKIQLQQKEKDSFFKQFYWLTRRYLKIKLNDRLNMAIMIGQAPLIALLMIIVFSKLTVSVLFLVTICAIWFGANNAAKEIVSELPIYERERMFNLRILPYMLSKISVLTLFSFLQALLFIGILCLWFNQGAGLDEGIKMPFRNSLFLMLFLSFSGVLMGLLLSTLFNNTEKVMTFLPLVLIPQIMLSGVVTPIDKKTAPEFISYAMFARWGVDSYAMVSDKVYHYSPSSTPKRSYYDAPRNVGEEDEVDPDDNYIVLDTKEALNLPNVLMDDWLEIEERQSLYLAKLFFILLIDLMLIGGIAYFLKKKDAI